MWVKELILTNVQSYKTAKLELSKGINVLIGPNNSGKSTVIKSLYKLQHQYVFRSDNIRKGSSFGRIKILLANAKVLRFGKANSDGVIVLPKNNEQQIWFDIRDNGSAIFYDNEYSLQESEAGLFVLKDKQGKPKALKAFTYFPQEEPNNFIYPFLARRKINSYEERVDQKNSYQITDDLRNLTSRIQHLIEPSHEEHANYIEACNDILGFAVGLIPGSNGSKIGIHITKHDLVPLENMGEGVANILGLIALLLTDKNKLFLIEELENDIHPEALKKLLRLIIKKSNENQFVISTHSNIVTKYLGSAPNSKLFQTSWSLENRIHTTTIKEVEPANEAKIKVLEDLGYELYDFNLWESYLILEESSAEVIINQFLIPWFAPGLIGRLRSVSANGISKIAPVFEDFQRLFLFTHLEPYYKNKAWVIIDGGMESEVIIEKLRAIYTNSGWYKNNFRTFSKSDFERFYPSKFMKGVERIFKLKENGKREQKKKVLEEVKVWAKTKPIEAKKEFSKSAKEVIEILKEIEKTICK